LIEETDSSVPPVLQIANIHWIIEKAREFQKNVCFIDYKKAFDCVDHNKLWNILDEMETDYLTSLLRNLYVGPEAAVRTLHGCTAWYLHSAVCSCWLFKRQCDINSVSGIVGFFALCMLDLVFLLIQVSF